MYERDETYAYRQGEKRKNYDTYTHSLSEVLFTIIFLSVPLPVIIIRDDLIDE